MTQRAIDRVRAMRASPRFAAVAVMGRLLLEPGHIEPTARGLQRCERVAEAIERSGLAGCSVVLINYTLRAAGPERDATEDELRAIRADFAAMRVMAQVVSGCTVRVEMPGADAAER